MGRDRREKTPQYNNMLTIEFVRAVIFLLEQVAFHGHYHSLTRSSGSLNYRWGIEDDHATTFPNSSLSSVFRRASSNPNYVHSDILSPHFFFCPPFLLPPCTVPYRMFFANSVDLVMCPFHLTLCFLTVVIRSPYGPITCLIVFLTSSFVI